MKTTASISFAVVLLSLSGCSAFAPILGASLTNHQQRPTQTQLFAKDNKGVYVRPSAAIERGSGFFFPGLEGPRVRLLFGVTLLVLTTVNHVLGDATSSLTETLAVGYSLFLLLQGVIEFGKEEMGYVVSLDRPEVTAEQTGDATAEQTMDASLIQRWATDAVSPGWKEKVQWSAASYLSLTPATHIMLLENDKVLYSLGRAGGDIDPDKEIIGSRAALETLSKAKSGRVSLPATHPAVTALAPQDCQGRCVVLQSINEEQCWIMASDQLLQAFTNQDLRWLGQLASYVKQ